MHTSIRRTTLCGCIMLACLGATPTAQAQVTYDMSSATVAKGPAGLIANNVWATTPVSTTVYTLGMTKSQQGPGCEFSGCADAIFGSNNHATADGALYFDLKDTPIGNVKELTATSSHSSAIVDRKAFIWGSSQDNGLYTDLIDPAHTSFSFTFSGHSAAAGQGAQVNFKLNDLNAPYDSLFSQIVSTNDAGDWQLVVNTPLGMDFVGKRIFFGLSAASGSNTVSSLLVSANVVAVPEPAVWSLMLSGLVGIAAVARRSRPTA